MLTKSDKQFILDAVEKSRVEVRKELSNVKKDLEAKMDKNKKDLEAKMDKNKKDLVEKILRNQDVLIGRLDNIDQDIAITSGQRDDLVDHDARITTLEKIHPQGKHFS